MPDFGKPIIMLSNMGGQLEAVRQDINSVKGGIVKYEQKLAASDRAHNDKRIISAFEDILRWTHR